MKRYYPSADIMAAILSLDDGEKIRAYFNDGRAVVYSDYMLDLLRTDSTVSVITSEKTGEVLYSAEG